MMAFLASARASLAATCDDDRQRLRLRASAARLHAGLRPPVTQARRSLGTAISPRSGRLGSRCASPGDRRPTRCPSDVYRRQDTEAGWVARAARRTAWRAEQRVGSPPRPTDCPQATGVRTAAPASRSTSGPTTRSIARASTPAQLRGPVEILGFPRLRLRVRTDRPRAVVIAPDCATSRPTGESLLVTRGVLNLTHRTRARPAVATLATGTSRSRWTARSIAQAIDSPPVIASGSRSRPRIGRGCGRRPRRHACRSMPKAPNSSCRCSACHSPPTSAGPSSSRDRHGAGSRRARTARSSAGT